jgi:hypothetical protein
MGKYCPLASKFWLAGARGDSLAVSCWRAIIYYIDNSNLRANRQENEGKFPDCGAITL